MFRNKAAVCALAFLCTIFSALPVRAQDQGDYESEAAVAPLSAYDQAQAHAVLNGATMTVPLADKSIRPGQYDGDVRNLPPEWSTLNSLLRNRWFEGENDQPMPHRLPPSGGATNVPSPPPPVILAPMPSPIQNFNGVAFNTTVTGGRAGAGFPPDTNGDVGPTYYIQGVNDAWGIYNKSTGAQVAAFTENQLWSGAGTGTPCDASNFGDPVVMHDAVADRWVLTNFAFGTSGSTATGTIAPYYQCIAISKTGDPVSGGWWLYAVQMDTGGTGAPPAGTLADYPKFGLWSDCLYMGANGFSQSTGGFVGPIFAAFNRTALYAGTALSSTNSSVGFVSDTNTFSMFPATYSTTLPPVGTPEYFVNVSGTAFAWEVRKFQSGANACGAGSTLGAVTQVSQASYGYPATGSASTNTVNIVKQPGTTNKLDSLGDRIMQRVVYRNVGGAESLWVTHTTCGSTQNSAGLCTSTSTTTQLQWAQINVTGGAIATTPVQQQIYTPDTTIWRWMPSIAVDKQGNMAIGYSTANGTAPNYPSLAYSGRLVTDPLGQLPETETQLYAGAGSQNLCGTSACSRWGDYSALVIDPSDDCTFWYTSEYTLGSGVSSNGYWGTRIGSFKFPGCTASVNNYTIGGGVSGLTGSGLVLAVTAGSQTVSVASGASSYVFPTAVPDGSAYTVSVQTQPTGQTCSVANASGTVSAANVTNANVTCTTNSYTIGGNVSGLTASGLVMAVTAGSQTVSVASGASSYVFPTAEPTGTAYTVSVQTQPTGQTCSVANATGTIASTNVTNANVSCTTNLYLIGGNISGLAGSVMLKLDSTSPTTTQTQTFAANGSFTFASSLAYGSGWTASVATQPTGQTCAVTSGSGTNLSANVTTVQVTCTTNTYTVTASVSGANGTITPASQSVNYNGAASFTVTPNTGYHVATVTGDTCTATQGSGNSWTSNAITQACAVTATFAINAYTVTASVTGGNGTITPASQSVNYNGAASFTLTPSTGYHVAAVTGDTCTVTQGSGNTWTSNAITQGCAVTATFAINTYTVTASVTGGNGTITPASQSVNYNGTASFTVTPNSGYNASVTGDTCTVTQGSGNTWTSGAVTANCVVTATFAIDTFTVTAAVSGGNGTITPPSQSVNSGSAANLTVTPNTGYHVASVTGDTCTATLGSGSVWTTSTITANCVVTATFAINTYTLTYTAGTNGSILGTTPQTVNYGASGTPVTATPSTGYHFVQWSDGVLTAARTDTNVTANVNVTASFAINAYTVTASVNGGNGTITPASQSVNYNGTASFTVTPSTGYHVASVSGDTCTITQGSGNTWTSNAITQACAVTATFAINAYTVTASVNGGNGTITPASQSVNYNGTASFTVTPSTGYHVATVTGDTCTATQGSGNSWTSNAITQACAVTATFAINSYTLTYTAGANGSISGTTPQTVSYGASGTLVTATPSTGYHFVQWSDGVLTAARTDANVTANLSVTASFAINTYTLTYTAGTNGSIVGATPQTVNYGASGTLVTATPSTGYYFVQWSDGVLTAARTDTNVTTNLSVTASFAINAYTVTASVSGGNGTITPPSQSVNYNGAASFTVTPATGYHVATVTGDTCAVTQGSGNTWTSNAITQACAVTATFAINTYTLTYTAGTNGSIVGATPQTVNYGASGTLVTATPSTGYYFVQWSDGVLTAARTDTNVTANLSVTASFAINAYTVTASVVGGNGTITPASQSVNYNGAASFTVTPSTGYHVAAVTGDTCTITQGSGNSWTSNAITQACAVTATFAINAYTVTASVSGGNGTITPASQSVSYNGAATFTVTPVSSAYHVASVVGSTCTVTQGTGATWTSGPITQPCAVTATFAINPPDHLTFVQQPADVFQGDRLGAVQIAIVDVNGNVIATDSSSQVTLSTSACGGSVTLGQATVSNGIASFGANASKRFYTLASGKQLSAASGSYSGIATVNVVTGGELVFADDFDSCRL